MSKIGSLYKWLPMAAVICLSACNDDDKNNNQSDAVECLELTASTTDIELDGDRLDDVVLTFEWTPAREMPEEYMISYVTKIDIEGSNFNSCVRNDEEEGVFSKSYTTAELQNLLTEKWGQSSNKSATIQFRVIAKWDGGTRWAKPEVRTVSVNVRPYKPIVFDADRVYLDGTAMTGGRITVSKTVENEYQYAFLGDLKQGELEIPVEFEGETNYICPADGEGTLQDGEAENVMMKAEPIAWNIPKDGEYRIVVNMEKKTVTIYSPDKKLEPVVVKWMDVATPPEEHTTVVTNLWMYGDGTGWGWWTGFTPSLADPQVLVYSGSAIKGAKGVKFVVDGGTYRNNAWAYSCKPIDDQTAGSASLALGVTGELYGGSSRGQRNSYYNLPVGANFIVLDLRNMTIRAEKR